MEEMQKKKFDLRKLRIVLVLACVVMQGIAYGFGTVKQITATGFLISDLLLIVSFLIGPINRKP